MARIVSPNIPSESQVGLREFDIRAGPNYLVGTAPFNLYDRDEYIFWHPQPRDQQRWLVIDSKQGDNSMAIAAFAAAFLGHRVDKLAR